MRTKERQQKRQPLKFDTGATMAKLLWHLISDCRNATGDWSRYRELEFLLNDFESNVPAIRRTVGEADFEYLSSYDFKWDVQIRNLWKRYRFTHDLYTDHELTQQALEKFKKVQQHLENITVPYLDGLVQTNPEVWAVLQYARIYIKRVLGQLCEDEVRRECNFGSRASIGVPLKIATESQRWAIPISGSPAQCSWFLEDIRGTQQEEYLAVQSADISTWFEHPSALKLTFVPKSFKSLRSIMPNTTLGGYISKGLGSVIAKRLRAVGANINTLQERHRQLAQSASITGELATADLSSASDSISEALVEYLLPPDWFIFMRDTRLPGVVYENRPVPCRTFCTMGIGYTFPLQTLIFRSLLYGVHMYHRFDRSSVIERKISVYGDDLIYPTWMHMHVAHVLEAIGFTLNLEKSFSCGPFRESCGGDYHNGTDVRPFQHEGSQASIREKPYAAFLYSLANGLCRRWREEELHESLAFLRSELLKVSGKIFVVPHDYPDTAGVQTSTARHLPQWLGNDVHTPEYVGHGLYRFMCLGVKPKLIKEVRHEPYYWRRMRNLGRSAEDVGTDLYVWDPVRGAVEYYKRHNKHLAGVPALINFKKAVKLDPNIVSLGPCQPSDTFAATFIADVRFTRQTGVSEFRAPKESC